MKRRSVLKLLALSPFSPYLLQSSLASEIGERNFFLSMTLRGGWDTTLCLDPWKESDKPDATDLFIEYGHDALIKNGNIFLGPGAAPIQSYANDMAIINGIFLSETDNGHDAAERYMLTGSTGQHSSMNLAFAGAVDFNQGIGVLSNSSHIRGASKVTTSSIYGIDSAYRNKLTGKQLKYFTKSQNHSSPLISALKQMVQNSPNMEELFNNLDKADLGSLENELKDATIVASAFSTHTSQFAHLDVDPPGEGFDTHSNHEGIHLNSQSQTFEVIKKVLDILKNTPYKNGESVYDRTTVMITSEFSRTAALNNAKGKDHNPMTNSMVLLGNGIKGNQVIGASRLVTRKMSQIGMPYQIALPYDFQSGQVIQQRVDGSQFITPENILRTLCDVIGADISKVSGITPETAVIKSLIA